LERKLVGFDARAVRAEAEDDYPPFEFTGLDGVEYQLPSPMLISTDQARELNTAMLAASEDNLFDLLRDLWPEAAYNAVMDMPAIVTAQLMDAWKAGIDEAGKPPSSPAPRNRAERRSKQTSSSAGSGGPKKRPAKKRPAKKAKAAGA
jgi:hypothetical protein